MSNLAYNLSVKFLFFRVANPEWLKALALGASIGLTIVFAH